MSAESIKPRGKKPGFWVVLAFLLSFGLLAVSFWFTMELIRLSDERQSLKYDFALMNDVKYGILDINAWKMHMGKMLNEKIEAFELTTENRETIKAEIERLLNQVIKEINKLLKQEAYSGMHGLFKGLLYEIFADIEEMRSKVPQYAQEIMDELDKPQNLKKLKEVLQEKIEDAFKPRYSEVDSTEIEAIFSRHACNSLPSCNAKLKKGFARTDLFVKDNFPLVVLPVALAFFLMFLLDDFGKMKVVVLVSGCLILLAGGLLIPMIEIDARIDAISFNLLGSKLTFENQILYYQSKSITEVVELLTRTGKWDLIGVGILILAFSVIFPILKLLCSVLLPWFPEAMRKNRISRFLIYRSGKWSLADVLVVALFMAYIGFRGLVDNQFGELRNALKGTDVLTTNHTDLQVGFTLFFCFCIASILMSVLLGQDYPEKSPG